MKKYKIYKTDLENYQPWGEYGIALSEFWKGELSDTVNGAFPHALMV